MDTEPELAIFYNQARLPAVRLEHQPSHKTFRLQCVLPASYGDNDDPECVEVANQWPVLLEAYAPRGTSCLTL